MFDGKFLVTLIGLIIAIFAICKMNSGVLPIEGFWMNSAPRTAKSMVLVDTGNRKGYTVSGHPSAGDLYSVADNYGALLGTQGMRKGDIFQVPGTWQSSLSPRFSNVDYGANIRYNMPSEQYQATPCNPLTFSNMVKEDYSDEGYCGSCGGGCGSVGCKVGGLGEGGKVPALAANLPPAGYAEGNYNQLKSTLEHTATTDMLPLGDMTTVNADGEVSNPVIMDRFIYANQKSRLYALGDPIRGDLPIVPCAPGWFRPSVHPHIDLRDGAMAVMGGVDNSTSRALYELQIAATDGIQLNQFGGVDMGANKRTMVDGVSRAVTVTAFP